MDHRVLTLAFLLLAVACARTPQVTAPTAEEVFVALERELILAPALALDFEVEADGVVSARLSGRLRRGAPGSIALDARGAFAERAIQPSLRANADTMTGGSGELFIEPAPPGLDDAVLLGFTRMGILHNLVMLGSGRPPDHARGGVREWLTVANVTLAADPDPEVHVLSFDIVVDGRTTASAVLWIDRASMRPLRRRQQVHFPNGTMTVIESYAWR